MRAGEMQREKAVLEATVRGLEQRLEEEMRRSARLTEGLESAQRDVADRVSEGMPATIRGVHRVGKVYQWLGHTLGGSSCCVA